ncbi:type III pantothenate kinase [Alicyclobacillus sp. SO9]|uniref:type III pantothenate kinase n=1 Tax=Alicyclobacillus sp. SO9 TaxID=2665646 RepID=UPI0018E8716D|nr:type III pantothenate kinase [Alicyclobacillus sp. SO9]QQE79428.1 type III pantothenate kinase [Alicyclobacillus sp. SO9]
MESWVLVLNVGNSSISIGVFSGAKLLHDWRVSTDIRRSEDELGLLLKALLRDVGLETQTWSGVCVSSVVPPLGAVLVATIRKYLDTEPLIVGPGVKTGLAIRSENPREIGADRIVNAVAAANKFDSPLIVVKLGTATTFCVIDETGDYVGGVIAPGVRLAADALYERTAKLPRVELAYPKHVVGKSTISSIQSGLLYGAAGLVDGIVTRISEEYALDFTVIATGGLAHLISPASYTINIVEPYLTLEGLRLIWQRNAGTSNC